MRDAWKAIFYLSYLKKSIASGAGFRPGVYQQGSVLDPAEEAYDVPPDPLVV